MTTTVESWLAQATARLVQIGITTARLDAFVLMSDEINKSKAQLLAHPEYTLTLAQLQKLNAKLARRAAREPMAYIRGRQEFFGRDFSVNPNVLIPRPETETLLELLLSLPQKSSDKLLDIGTGSGCIAITAKLAMPEWQVFASDTSAAALKIARYNARTLGANVIFYQQSLLAKDTHGPFAFIAANLPYVHNDWQVSPETRYEPQNALFAGDNGLALIKQLISQSTQQLAVNGYLLLEADPRQHQAIIDFSASFHYRVFKQKDFAIVLQGRG